MLCGSRSLRVVVGAVASSVGVVAVARRSRRRCLRRCAGAPSAGSVVPPHLRRRGARSQVVRGGGSPSRRGCSAQRLALSACGCWRGRFLSGGGRLRAALTAPPPSAPRWRSWCRLGRAAALAASWRSAAALPRLRLAFSAHAYCLAARALCVRSLALSLPLWRWSRSCAALRAPLPAVPRWRPDAGSIVPPRSRRREARPPHVNCIFKGRNSN